jgi:hypothetical protein
MERVAHELACPERCSLSPNIYKEGLHLPLLSSPLFFFIHFFFLLCLLLSSSFTIIEKELKWRLHCARDGIRKLEPCWLLCVRGLLDPPLMSYASRYMQIT